MICGWEPRVSTLSSSGSFHWAGGVFGLPELYAPSVQHQTGQVTAEATLPSTRAPGVLREGRGPEARWSSSWWALLSPHSRSARPGEALPVSMLQSLSSLLRLGQLGGAVAAFHTHQGRGDTPDPPETMRLELCGPCGQSDPAPTDRYPRVPQAL